MRIREINETKRSIANESEASDKRFNLFSMASENCRKNPDYVRAFDEYLKRIRKTIR